MSQKSSKEEHQKEDGQLSDNDNEQKETPLEIFQVPEMFETKRGDATADGGTGQGQNINNFEEPQEFRKQLLERINS